MEWLRAKKLWVNPNTMKVQFVRSGSVLGSSSALCLAGVTLTLKPFCSSRLVLSLSLLLYEQGIATVTHGLVTFQPCLL